MQVSGDSRVAQPPPFETKLFHFHGDIFENLGKINKMNPRSAKASHILSTKIT